jgi:hypothetical protein
MADQVKTGVATQLRIRWDGDVQGIAEHRLSLANFGQPLALLLHALRRIATQMVSTAVDRPKFGRFANLARQLDIQVIDVEGNSTGIDAVVSFTPPPDMLPLFGDVAERAVSELLDSIKLESDGTVRDSAVRGYLQSLPLGVHKQLYELHDNGLVKKSVDIGDLKLSGMPPELPYLRTIEGDIVGVGFEPGRNEVRIKPESGNIAALGSSAEIVDQALDMRHNKVRTLAVHTSKGTRVISLKRASDPRFRFDPKVARTQIFERWDNVLRELSK